MEWTAQSKLTNASENMLDALAEFVEIFEGFAIVRSTRSTLANMVGKTNKTITRTLQRMEKEGLLVMESRAGRCGGIVVKFEPGVLQFEKVPNIWVSPTEEDKKILEQALPIQNNGKRKPKGKRRTKAEMMQARADILAGDTKNAQLNKSMELFGIQKLTWDMLKETDNPDESLDALLLALMYDQFRLAYYEYYRIKKIVHFGRRVPPPVLPKKFFGSRQWALCLKLSRLLADENLDADNYLGFVFDRFRYRHEEGGSKQGFPSLEHIVSDIYVKAYRESKKNLGAVVEGLTMLPSNRMGNPNITAIAKLRRTNELLESKGLVKEAHPIHLLDKTFGNDRNVTKQKKQVQAYHDELRAEVDPQLTEREKEVLYSFLEDNYTFLSGRSTWATHINPSIAVSMPSVARSVDKELTKRLGNQGEITIERYRQSRGYASAKEVGMDVKLGINATEDDETEFLVTNGMLIGTFVTPETVFHLMVAGRICLERAGKHYSLEETKEVLQKVQDAVPLNKYGYLDLPKIYDKYPDVKCGDINVLNNLEIRDVESPYVKEKGPTISAEEAIRLVNLALDI
ncbi:HTH DNA binding protein [Brochothrix phage A9]|uniref:Gp114 n=1 Tax=Brochothrix phage A9 TaxID=857312 RepID=D9J0R1_9CAUD|nr:HTH DNA binding protein [Brochothrix phage A9]ADJ53148.1 gp114 [Brochothrix phage A9]